MTNIHLKILSPFERDEFIERIKVNYVNQMLEAKQGYDSQSIEDYSREQIKQALAETEKNLFYGIYNKTVRVGELWVAIEVDCGQKTSFLYYIHIDETFRRNGFAYEGIKSLEKLLEKDFNVKSLSLNVFGLNNAAISLYKKLEFEVYTMKMTRIFKD